jgi:hypothetical protein
MEANDTSGMKTNPGWRSSLLTNCMICRGDVNIRQRFGRRPCVLNNSYNVGGNCARPRRIAAPNGLRRVAFKVLQDSR